VTTTLRARRNFSQRWLDKSASTDVDPCAKGQRIGGERAYNMKTVRGKVSMTIEEQVLEKLRELPAEKQQEVLDFVAFLKEKNGSRTPLRSLRGLWKDFGIHITEEDIAEARREMWGNFPRDIS
jgi:uncharacterized protein DUF2281